MNKQLKRGLSRLLASDVNLQSFTFWGQDLLSNGFDKMKVTIGYCEEFFTEGDKSPTMLVFRKKFRELMNELTTKEEILEEYGPQETTLMRSEIMRP